MRVCPNKKPWLLTAAVTLITSALFAGVTDMALGSSAPPQVAISSIPMTVVIPTHPQVLIAVGNSNSMDSSDNVTDDSSISGAPSSSAIMTWSGIPVGNALDQSSSPVNYQIPSGFTPPVGSNGNGQAPYTYSFGYTDPTVQTGNGGNYWYCAVNNTTPITTSGYPTSLPRPNNPPTSDSDWPSGLTWNNTVTWWYNGNGNYSTSALSPITMLWKPSAERLATHSAMPPDGISAVSPAAMLLGLGNVSDLAGGNGSGAHTRSTGSGTPTPPCGTGPGDSGTPCPTPVTYYCHLWEFAAAYTYPYHNSWNGQIDNAPSRMNITKAAITKVISTYAGETDFGLLDYSVSGVNWYPTWAYYISPAGGFSFSSTVPAAGTRYVNNPCHNNPGGWCNSIISTYGSTANTSPYLIIGASADDPDINDVFLTGSFNQNIFEASSGPTPGNPYTSFTLSQYNTNQVELTYSVTTPSIGGTGALNTYPTNAGYVAYSPEVAYARRGWLQSGTPSATTGNLLVPITSSGQNPTQAQITAYLANFSPYLVSEPNFGSIPSYALTQAATDCTANPASAECSLANYNNNHAIYSNAGQSPIAGMLSKALTYYNSNPPSSSPNGCTPPRYVILMTDGLPTEDLSGKNWPPIGSAAAAGYAVTASFDPTTGALTSTNDQALQDTITELTDLNNAGVKTFVVGLGPGVDPTLNPQAAQALTAMAVAGGTNSYFAATSATAVAQDMQTIISTINALNVSSVSAAVNGSGLNTGTVVYQASYTGYDTPYFDWTGNLQAFPVNATTGVVSTSATWSAQCQLDTLATGSSCPNTPGMGAGWDTSRLIATWNPTSGTAVPFRWSDISSTQQSELMTSPTDILGPDRLDYLRGDTAEEQRNGGTFRNRSHILGDIVDSAALYVGASNGPYLSDPSYQTFATSTASRTPMIYVGANDGMLHAFDANTGQEKFAFIPNGVFPNLVNLSAPTYNNAHQFYVDGSPSAGDVKFSDGSWHTVLVGGLNDGGQSIYALDVTNPAAITTESTLASNVLWEFTDSTLGLTYSQPVIALTNDTGSTNANSNGFLVFFGSGYNNSDGNDYLYAVNPQTGQLVAKINLCAAVPGTCSSTLPNGLSSPVVINSGGNLSAPADTVYAGDLQGNLWKVDISNANPSSWVVSLLFQALGPGNVPQPITVTPAVSLVPNFPGASGTVVYFGTGQYLGTPDITNTNVQSFYAVLDNGAGTATLSQLVQQTLTNTSATINGATVTLRTVTNNPVNWNTSRGWYMNLPNTGERVITNPRLYNGEVVFTTYAPSPADLCTGGGTSFLMAVNYSNGGSFPQPQLDINGDGQLNASDQVNGQNPVGIGLGSVYASAPTILSASQGAIQAVKLTTLSTGAILNVGERGGQSGRSSWWQIH